MSSIHAKILDRFHLTSVGRTGGTLLDEDGNPKPDEGKRLMKANLEAYKKNLELKIPFYLIFGAFANSIDTSLNTAS